MTLTGTALLGLLAGCGEEAATTGGEAPPPEVEVLTVAAEAVTLRREFPGRTNAYLVAEIRPQVTGIVQERLFEEGGFAKAGEVLYQLDDAMYRAEYERAKAQLARAEATRKLEELKAKRSRELLASEAVSQQELDEAEAALDQAAADVGVAKAALAAAEVQLGYTRIVSPISGVIGKSAVTAGALVTANQGTSLATVRQLDPIYVDLAQSSREMMQLRKQLAAGGVAQEDTLPVSVKLEDGTAYPHAGEVAFAEATVDPTTGTYLLRVVVPNPDHELVPGMFVRAETGLGVIKEAILVPQKAVTRGPGGDTTVMLVAGDGTVEQREIGVIQTVGNRWLVGAGLAPGDRVVVEGLQKVQPGVPVRIASETKAAQ